MRLRRLLLLPAFVALLAGPACASDFKQEVAARHALERKAHMNRDVDLLLSLSDEDVVTIDGGQVTKPTRAESRARFQKYFHAVRFRKWDDMAPPEIRVSRDGSLATVIAKKEVVIVPADAPDGPEERTVFAWMETWERRGCRYVLVAICSTRADAETAR